MEEDLGRMLEMAGSRQRRLLPGPIFEASVPLSAKDRTVMSVVYEEKLSLDIGENAVNWSGRARSRSRR